MTCDPHRHHRINWRPKTPFLLAAIKRNARAHLWSGTWPASMTDPTVIVARRTSVPAASISTSGEHQQDNDLVIIRDAGVAAKFDAHFERMWDGAQPMIEFEPAIRALEPR